MNERAAKVGNQVKQAFGKLRDGWKAQEPARKKRILMIAAGLVALTVVLVIIFSAIDGRYVVLYEGMSQDDQVKSVSVLDTSGIAYRMNGDNDLEVPQNQLNRAMAALAMQGLPSVTLPYQIASGLTTTESEKQQAMTHGWQNRLQDTFKTWDGVQNAYVTLNLGTSSNRVWDTDRSKKSGSVTFTMEPGAVLSAGQVQAVRHVVGSSVGIDPKDVAITDQRGNLLAAMGEEYSVGAAATMSFLDRMDLEAAVEEDIIASLSHYLSIAYPNPEDYAIVPNVVLDTDSLVQEMKEYAPLDGTIHGVTSTEEVQALMGAGDFAAGVVGETDNTDVPIYVDENGDGVIETVDYARLREYLVSYTLTQRERTTPEIASITASVHIRDAGLSAERRQELLAGLAAAGSVLPENLTLTTTPPPPTVVPPVVVADGMLFGIPFLYWLIAAGALLLLIIVLIFVLVLRAKGRKKRRLAAEAAAAAEAEEAERIQNEIEERKKQLKNAALGDPGEDAIAGEVRDFARANPEITANLLRNWLKEGE